MLTVLIVEDDTRVRETFRFMLESAGMEVAEAGNGEEGVRAFRRSQADVVLCDLFMPGKDGLELIRELRREFPGVKVIAMSGGGFKGTLDMLPMARNLGAVGVLYKPFVQSEVLTAIRKVVEPVPAM